MRSTADGVCVFHAQPAARACDGGGAAAALATGALSGLLYLGYNDFFPSSFYRFSLIHYVSWLFLPLLAAAAGVCWSGWKIRVVWLGWGGALLLFVLASGLQLVERPLPAGVGPGEVRRCRRRVRCGCIFRVSRWRR